MNKFCQQVAASLSDCLLISLDIDFKDQLNEKWLIL
jgi:hypothetical protein